MFNLDTSKLSFSLNLLKVIMCIYMVILIVVKIRYREVLPPLGAGILIDVMQIVMSVLPFIMIISEQN